MDHLEVLLESLSICTKVIQRMVTNHRIGWNLQINKMEMKKVHRTDQHRVV